MKDLILGKSGDDKVMIMRKVNGKIVEEKNVTAYFNQIIISSFKKEKEIRTLDGSIYKVSVEKAVRSYETRFGTIGKKTNLT